MRAAVATELAAPKSVAASGDSAATSAHDPALNLPLLPNTSRDVVVDPQTREVIYREISKRSGEVVSQIPGDAMLKLMEYYRGISKPAGDHNLQKTS